MNKGNSLTALEPSRLARPLGLCGLRVRRAMSEHGNRGCPTTASARLQLTANSIEPVALRLFAVSRTDATRPVAANQKVLRVAHSARPCA